MAASGQVVALVLFLQTLGAAGPRPPRPVIQGSWIATAGERTLRGTWSAQALPRDLDTAVGSWTLQNDDGDVVLGGTWSAHKAPRAWRGTWQARVQGSGQSFSGTWQAALGADGGAFKGKTFEDMLRAVGTQQISGNWRSGRAGGNWWLKTLP